MRFSLLLAASAVMACSLGCGKRSEDMPSWPPFEMTIPKTVPDEMTVRDKDGVAHPANGKQLYADGYRAGWKRCVDDYRAGELDLFAEQVDPPALQDYGIAVRGWEAGYEACWAAIRKAERPTGKSGPSEQGKR